MCKWFTGYLIILTLVALFVYLFICVLHNYYLALAKLMVINLCYDAERKGGFSSPFQARFAKHPFYRFSTRHVSSYFIFIRLAQNLILFMAIFMM